MSKPAYYFVPYENKIPCGGFSTLGGGRSKNIIADEASMELLGKMSPAEDNDGNTVNYKRTLFINLEDWYKILQIVSNMAFASPPQEIYDIRFESCDYMTYLRYGIAFADNSDRIQNTKTVEDWVQVIKEIFPEAFGGEVMDGYDVSNMYYKTLGFKIVPSTFQGAHKIEEKLLLNIMMNYFNVEGTITGVLAFFPAARPCLIPDLSSLFVPSEDAGSTKVTIEFFDENSPEYPLHKNKVTISTGIK